MSGRGRRGRWGRGGAKRSREEFEKKASSTPESTQPVAPLPGGFKSMKAKWISVYESEQKAQESSQPVRPASADTSNARKLPATEPLGPKPAASMPQSASEHWRTERPPEAAGDRGKKQDNGSSVVQQSKRPRALEGQKAESKEQRPLSADVSEQGAPDEKWQKQETAASYAQAAATLPEPASSTAEAIGGASKALPAPYLVEDRPKDAEAAGKEPSSFESLQIAPGHALKQTPAGSLAQDAGPAKAASERSPGKVAAMQDAAASLKAASKAHSSIRAPLSPERAPAESSKPAAAAQQPGSEAKLEVPTEVKAKAAGASADGSGDHTKLETGQQEERPRSDSVALVKAEQLKAELKQGVQGAKESSAAKDTAEAGDLKKHGPKDKTGGTDVSESVLKQRKQKGQKGIPPSQKDPPTQPQSASGTASEEPAGRQQGPNGQRAGQRAAQKANNDAASRSQVKKAIAQAKAAAAAEAEAADSHQQADLKAEERGPALKAQQQDNQIAQQEVPALAQQAPEFGTAAGAEEASRQKGSDASSLERSPDIPQKQQQQPLGEEAPVRASGSKHVKQGKSLAEEHQHQTPGDVAQPKPVGSAVPGTGHSSQLAPVEYLGDGPGSSQQLGQIDLSQYDSYRALWAGLREDYGQALPKGLSLRLVYEDGEGDFVMLQPDEPWATFLSSARRVIISCQ